MLHFDPVVSAADVTGLKYWDLHGFLLLPTLWLLTIGKPQMLLSDGAAGRDAYDELRQTAAYSFIAFILAISVAQAFIWDSVGAEIGIWEFNPAKCTGLGDASLLPVEEVAWLFHHVMKAALWQLKVAELDWTTADDAPSALPKPVRDAGNVLLAVMGACGAYALQSDADALKCVGLVAAFFAPVFLIVFNLGRRYLRSHWRLFLIGWLPPGLWTVAIDCLGQTQDVWFFPPRYLTGIAAFDGWLKLDIAAVYMVSTLAVTATGAIILAACEEMKANAESEHRTPQTAALTSNAAAVDAAAAHHAASGEAHGSAVEAHEAAAAADGTTGAAASAGREEAGLTAPPNLWDLLLFIFDGAFPGAAAWPSRAYLDRFTASAGDEPPSGEQQGASSAASRPALEREARREVV